LFEDSLMMPEQVAANPFSFGGGVGKTMNMTTSNQGPLRFQNSMYYSSP
jgi:hypothetical protein